MNHLPDFVNKYLKKYSSDKYQIESQPLKGITNVVVVPVISEYQNLRKMFSSLLQNNNKCFNKTAVVIVVNNFQDSSEEIKTDNRKTITFIRNIIAGKSEDDLEDELVKSNLSICLVDASSNGSEMPNKIGGVGFVRKIGMDNSLKIFDYKSSAKKILICLDADCTVETNYLNTIVDEFNQKNLSAATIKFKHSIHEDSQTAPAIICYEIYLRYYVLGLKYAESPFAFHTLGSTMVCDYESYIKVEGMNKRKAAEDFYFLEKLAKNVKVEQINSTTVYPSSRSSWRVPFGTGQRVERFLSNTQNEYLLYDPKSFDLLKQWLGIFTDSSNTNPEYYLDVARKVHPELCNFLLQQNFTAAWNKIFDNSTTTKQITKQKQKWFDGFRTLKLIHYLRDTALPQINMFDALNGMFEKIGIRNEFFWYEKSVPNLDVQRRYLELLRELT